MGCMAWWEKSRKETRKGRLKIVHKNHIDI